MARQKLDFDGMSVAELVELREQLDRVVGERASAERNDLMERLNALDKLHGRRAGRGTGRRARVSVANGNARGPHPLKGTKAPVKYVGPNGEKWSGRGLAPRWLTELEGKGKKRDNFLVERAN